MLKLFKQFVIKRNFSKTNLLQNIYLLNHLNKSSSNDNNYKIVRKIHEIHTFFYLKIINV